MIGKSKKILFNLLISTIINIILNILLIPRYGLIGAAFATMSSYIFWSILSFIQADYYLSIVPFRKKMITILFVAIIPTILLLYIKQFIIMTKFTLIIQGICFILLYFFLILFTNCLDKNDLMILRSIKEKMF